MQNEFSNEELEELRIAGIQAQIDEKKTALNSYNYIGTEIAMEIATKDEYAKEIEEYRAIKEELVALEMQLTAERG